MKEILKYAVPASGVIFWGGIQTTRIDELFRIVNISLAEEQHNKDIMMDMHGRLCKIEQSVHNIEQMLHQQSK